ncbi:MAG: HIT family protein [Ilumatobacteraceae bacterium]
MATVFTRILNGELPGTFVYRDEHCAVFMSINPLATGHCLVVPVREVDHWVDLRTDEVNHLFTVAHQIAQAQRSVFLQEKIGMIVAGYEVPHTHIHLVPTHDMSQLDFANAARSVDRDALEAAAEAIRSQIAA